MSRIKIKDLPVHEEMTPEQTRRLAGGHTGDTSQPTLGIYEPVVDHRETSTGVITGTRQHKPI